MDLFDLRPQKFYLLSNRKRVLIDFSSADHEFAYAVDHAFDSIKCMVGGNVHGVYLYDEQTRKAMLELSDKYKNRYPFVQQLPAYFKDFIEGDYFIRQKSKVSLMDLKRAVLEVEARTLGIDVNKYDSIFVQNWGRLFLLFDTYSYGFLTDKVYIGEKDKSKRICRFCKRSGAERFKSISHALQEGLGNHLLFANEECDECNSMFSNKVETPLYKFLEINRTLSSVKGKETRNHSLEGLNFQIRPNPVTKQPVVYVMQEHVVNDLYKGKITGKILLYNKTPITFQGIYKALLKFAVDMIPTERKQHFVKTGEWVHGDFECNTLPPFSYGEHELFFEQPVIDLFFRTEKTPIKSPYCIAVLYIYNSIFIYTLPFNDIDNDKYMTYDDVASNLKYFQHYEYLYVKEWVEYDSNDRREYAAQCKIPVLGIAGKYTVEYRPSNDEIFKIKRKN